MDNTLHIFSGKFDSLDAACLYSQEQWQQPIPDDTWTEEEEDAYYEDNPSWTFMEELDCSYLNPDFIETVSAGDLSYLKSQLKHESDFAQVAEDIPKENNVLVLVMSEALGGFSAKIASTSQLTYHGEFAWDPYN